MTNKKVTPYKASSEAFTLGTSDQDIVNRYRGWLNDYFSNEFSYDQVLYTTLTKVKEMIANVRRLCWMHRAGFRSPWFFLTLFSNASNEVKSQNGDELKD